MLASVLISALSESPGAALPEGACDVLALATPWMYGNDIVQVVIQG